MFWDERKDALDGERERKLNKMRMQIVNFLMEIKG